MKVRVRVRMSRSAPPIIRLARLVAGEAAPSARVRVLILRTIQDSPSFSDPTRAPARDCRISPRYDLRRKTSTEHGALRTSISVTLPISMCSIPPRPRVDITIRSMACSLA